MTPPLKNAEGLNCSCLIDSLQSSVNLHILPVKFIFFTVGVESFWLQMSVDGKNLAALGRAAHWQRCASASDAISERRCDVADTTQHHILKDFKYATNEARLTQRIHTPLFVSECLFWAEHRRTLGFWC